MIDLVYDAIKLLYSEFKKVMEFRDKLGAYHEEGDDLAERIACVFPCVLRLGGALSDDLLPSLSAMKKILHKCKVWTEKVMDYVKANSGTNVKLVAGYLKNKVAGLKIPKGYVKQVDSMLDLLGPEEPGKMFDKLASKFESAVNILSLTVGTQLLTGDEVAAHDSAVRKHGPSANIGSLTVGTQLLKGEEVAAHDKPAAPVPQAIARNDEPAGGGSKMYPKMEVAEVAPAAVEQPAVEADESSAAEADESSAAPPPDMGLDPEQVGIQVTKVEMLTGNVRKAQLSEVENMSMDLVEDLVDKDVPDLLPLRVNRSSIFPSVFILSYGGKRWLVVTMPDRSIIPVLGPIAFTSTNTKTIERIQRKASSQCCQAGRVISDMLSSSSVTYHALCCGKHVTGRWHAILGALPGAYAGNVNFVTHVLPNLMQCVCLRGMTMTFNLESAKAVSEGAAQNKLTIVYGVDMSGSYSCVASMATCQVANTRYQFMFNGEPLEV